MTPTPYINEHTRTVVTHSSLVHVAMRSNPGLAKDILTGITELLRNGGGHPTTTGHLFGELGFYLYDVQLRDSRCGGKERVIHIQL